MLPEVLARESALNKEDSSEAMFDTERFPTNISSARPTLVQDSRVWCGWLLNLLVIFAKNLFVASCHQIRWHLAFIGHR